MDVGIYDTKVSEVISSIRKIQILIAIILTVIIIMFIYFSCVRYLKPLNDFASVVKKVNENAKTQMQALGFVETRIDHISSITQKNQEVSQECASISEDLAGKAVDLTGMIEKFKK